MVSILLDAMSVEAADRSLKRDFDAMVTKMDKMFWAQMASHLLRAEKAEQVSEKPDLPKQMVDFCVTVLQERKSRLGDESSHDPWIMWIEAGRSQDWQLAFGKRDQLPMLGDFPENAYDLADKHNMQEIMDLLRSIGRGGNRAVVHLQDQLRDAVKSQDFDKVKDAFDQLGLEKPLEVATSGRHDGWSAIDLAEQACLVAAPSQTSIKILDFVLKKARPEDLLQTNKDGHNAFTAVDQAGRSMLMWAVVKGQSKLMQLLLKKQADVNITSRVRDRVNMSPLLWTAGKAENPDERDEEVRVAQAELLLRYRADVNQKQASGWSSLVAAAWHGWPKLVELLLRSRADPLLKTNREDTALVLAKEKKRTDVVKLLEAAAGLATDGGNAAVGPQAEPPSPKEGRETASDPAKTVDLGLAEALESPAAPLRPTDFGEPSLPIGAPARPSVFREESSEPLTRPVRGGGRRGLQDSAGSASVPVSGRNRGARSTGRVRSNAPSADQTPRPPGQATPRPPAEARSAAVARFLPRGGGLAVEAGQSTELTPRPRPALRPLGNRAATLGPEPVIQRPLFRPGARSVAPPGFRHPAYPFDQRAPRMGRNRQAPPQGL